MAEVRILYWKEVPSQVQARDDQNEFSVLLQERFQQGIDSIAMQDGSFGTDQYLDGWQWGDYKKIKGSADEVSKKLAKTIEENRIYVGISGCLKGKLTMPLPRARHVSKSPTLAAT